MMSRHLPPNDTPIQLIKPLFLPLLWQQRASFLSLYTPLPFDVRVSRVVREK